MLTGVCRPLLIDSYCFRNVMKWKWCGQVNNPSWQLQVFVYFRLYKSFGQNQPNPQVHGS